MLKDKYFPYFPAILCASFVVGLLVGGGFGSGSTEKGVSWNDDFTNEKALTEAYNLIESRYYKDVEKAKVVDYAISEMVDQLDPYSLYIPADHSAYMQYTNTGSYKGIGVETVDIDSSIYISKVIENGPADIAKISQGSKLIKVDTIDIRSESWTSRELQAYLLEHQSDSLEIVLSAFPNGEPSSFYVKATDVKVPNISISKRVGNSGYIKLSKFGADVYKEFMTSLEGLVINDSLEYLIIDVRQNPGGYLNEVCKILSQLIPEKTNILNTINGYGDKEVYNSTGQNFFYIGDIAIIIDDQSASASEILAGVLQDLDRSIILGQPSYGKGLVQEQFQLENGGVLRLSISKYQLPSGRYLGQADSLRYTSLKDNRPLSSTGKIDPDQLLELDPMFSNNNLFQAAISDFNTYDEILEPSEVTSSTSSIQIEKTYLKYKTEDLLDLKLKADEAIQSAINFLERSE